MDPGFEAFVTGVSPRLLRSAFLLIGEREAAEDALQVVLLRTARRWEVAQASPEAYAYRVLINLLHDRRRALARRVPERPLAEDGSGGPPAIDPAELVAGRDAIMRALRALAPRQREVVVLRYLADLSVAETATVLGTSEGSVKTHTSRALAHLREALADENESRGARC